MRLMVITVVMFSTAFAVVTALKWYQDSDAESRTSHIQVGK